MKPLDTFKNISRSKQDRIMAAAVEEFSERGYSKASINAIISRLNIAKGSIFQYFGDKKGLFFFVFDQSMEMVKDYLRSVRDQTAEEEIFVRLEKTLLAGISFLKSHPMIYRLYTKILFEYDIPFRNEILSSLRQYSFGYLRSLLDAGWQRGEIRRDIHPDRIGFLLDAVLDRFLQAQTIPYLDAGLGLYECDEAVAKQWAADLIAVLRTGIGATGDVER